MWSVSIFGYYEYNYYEYTYANRFVEGFPFPYVRLGAGPNLTFPGLYVWKKDFSVCSLNVGPFHLFTSLCCILDTSGIDLQFTNSPCVCLIYCLTCLLSKSQIKFFQCSVHCDISKKMV